MSIPEDLIHKYEDLDWKYLLRDDLGPSGNLRDAQDNLKRIKESFDFIFKHQDVLSQIPNLEIRFRNFLGEFFNSFTETIKNYSDIREKLNIVSIIRNFEDRCVSELSPFTNYLNLFNNPNQKNEQTLVELKKQSDEVGSLLVRLKVEAEKLQDDIVVFRKTAFTQEVSIYGDEFDKMAVENNKKAIKNLFGLGLSLSVTLVLAIVFVYGKMINVNTENISLKNLFNVVLEQNVLLKLFVISAGGYLVAFFSRNYSAEKNMYYMNKHRQMALNSHQNIIQAVQRTQTNNEMEVKNQILLQVARTMFDVQETGYLKNGSNPVPTTQIIETVRSGVSKD